MKALLAGIGSFGMHWYRAIKAKAPDLKLSIAEPDPSRAAQLTGSGDSFYTSFKKAVEIEKPDFVINATPPNIHTAISQLAFDHRLPVLSEKPISPDFQQAVEIVARAKREQILFVIAESHRREPIMRIAHQLIEDGEIGEVDNIHIQFFRDQDANIPYLYRMANPMLVDVAAHHIDCIRYLTGSEGKHITATCYNPKSSRFPGNAAVNFNLEMANGVQVSYTGNLSCQGFETTWHGNWRIEGTRGILIIDPGIQLLKEGFISEIDIPGSMDAGDILLEFIAVLQGKRQVQTPGSDYLSTQAIVHFAEQSSQKHRAFEIELPVVIS
jgi:predicted dehydrogenase